MNQLGETINVEEFKKGRQLDCKDLMKYFSAHNYKFWSWGARGFINIFNYGLKFRVAGHHHKGHVYIALNGADLFDVYLTSIQGKIQHIMNDVYIEDLFTQMDDRIERIPEYKS